MSISGKLLQWAGMNRVKALAAAAGMSLLAGCVSPTTSDSAFKFTVFHYKEPVEIASWDYDPARNDCPESAALNVATLILHGDVDSWLTRWNAAERPNLTADERAALRQKWEGLKDSNLAVLNSIVSGATTVIEFRVETKDHQVQKLQVPLVHANAQWELTGVDPSSAFLHWETSNNKIVSEVDGGQLTSYLHLPAKTAPQARL
jgi:hypothetical protein